MAEVEQARRGRPPLDRGTERRARRFREGDTEIPGLKLPIPDSVRERFPATEYDYRWFRDTPGRLHSAHTRDWDPVEGVEHVPGAADDVGNPVNHVLHVKFKDWIEADRDKREERRKEIEGQMSRGEFVAGKGDDATGPSLTREVSYASESNRLS